MTENQTGQTLGNQIHPLVRPEEQLDDMRDHIADMYVFYSMHAKNYERARKIYQTMLYLDQLLNALAGESIPATELKEVGHE